MGIFKAAVPGLTRLAFFQNPGEIALEQLSAVGQTLGFQVQLYEAAGRDAAALEQALEAAANEGADGRYFVSGPRFGRNRALIVDFAASSHLPAVLPFTDLPAEAGLMSVSDARDRRIAAMVDQVLRGTSPSNIPVESPADSKLVVSLKTARALGLTIPLSILVKATQIIDEWFSVVCPTSA